VIGDDGMKKIVIQLVIGVFMMFSVTACFSSGGGSDCSQAEIDWFWEDFGDNGVLDYNHECGAEHSSSDPSDNGFGIEAPKPKQSACNMDWSLEWDVPVSGPYNLNWTPQNGAVAYEVVVTGPNGEQTILESKSSDLTLMMEDFPEGSYTYEVRAKDLYGNFICSIAVEFNKPVAEAPDMPGSIQKLQTKPEAEEKANGEEQEQYTSEPPQNPGFTIIIVPPGKIQPVEPVK